MKSSADIRKDNKKTVYRFMLNGKSCTKQQVSQGTGLSVATCNTLLNDLCAQGIVTGERKQLAEVGRSSVLYQIRPGHESYLAIRFTLAGGKRWVESLVFSATGQVLSKSLQPADSVSCMLLEEIVSEAAAAYPNLGQIIISIPGITRDGIIKHCDIPELENLPVKQALERKFSLAVAMENDMHHKAYGYYTIHGNQDAVISLCCFPSHFLPGTATIHKGSVIQGANGIAGMLGFLPCDLPPKEQEAVLNREQCVPLVTQSIRALIALLNPDSIVLTGDLIDGALLKEIRERCGRDIPPEYMPVFTILDSFDEYEYEGMYQLAVDRKIL